MRCCYLILGVLRCWRRAHYVLWNGTEPFYDHSTESCARHLAALMDDSYEHHVFRLASDDVIVMAENSDAHLAAEASLNGR